MSAEDEHGSQNDETTHRHHDQEDENNPRRRYILWLLLLLCLLLIIVVVFGPRLSDSLRRNSGVDTRQENQAAGTESVNDSSTDDPVNTQADCGDGICAAGEVCPADCDDTGRNPDDTDGEGSAARPPDTVTPTSENCLPDCLNVELDWATAGCEDESDCGSCGDACIFDDDCLEGLTCQGSVCWNNSYCVEVSVLPENDEICAEHGGLQWQGEVCLCSGFVDQVTICADGLKIDNVTDVACTPDPAACQPGGSSSTGSGESGGAVCGNGVVEQGEQCDGSAAPCIGADAFCSDACYCDVLK